MGKRTVVRQGTELGDGTTGSDEAYVDGRVVEMPCTMYI